ncbi:hypothetical protein ACIBF1_18970 [Spirillospora sp. NPDC050679]
MRAGLLERRQLGRERAARHWALHLPADRAGRRYAPVPAWTLDRVRAGAQRGGPNVVPDAWRLYAVLCDMGDRDGALCYPISLAELGEGIHKSDRTVQRRLGEPADAELVQVSGRPGFSQDICSCRSPSRSRARSRSRRRP